MRILIVVDVYPPEVSSAATLIHELAHGLEAVGDEVYVATTFPRHYLSGKAGGDSLKEFYKEGGVNIIRTKTLPLRKINFVIRGISQLLLPFLVFRKIKKYIKGDLDGVIVYSPPLPLAVAGRMVKRKYGAKFMLNLWDIFPQNAIDLGVLKSKLAIKMFEVMEQFAYKNADVLTFHGEGGRQFLIDNKGIPSQKIFLLHHWVDFASYGKPLRKDFRKEYDLENKFIFLFAGVMGPAQGLEFLVEVANKVGDLENVCFLLVGDGMEKPKIAEALKKHNLKNVLVKNFVSAEEYPDLAAIADVGVVCLSPQNKTPFLPGKFMGYMAAGKPIIAFLNKESDGFGLVEKAHCGYAVVADNLGEAERATRELYNMGKGELLKMGSGGLDYAKKHLSLEGAVAKIRELLKKD